MPKCGLCNNFQRKPRQFRFTFDCSEAELSRAANDGCIQCALLLEGFRHFEPELEGSKNHDSIHIWGDKLDGDSLVEMEIFSDGTLKLQLEFFVTKGKNSPLRGARMLPTIPGDTRASASTNWAKQRLQQCTDSHESCGQRIIPKLPSRVLDIRPERGGRASVKLLHVQGKDAQYACLSHRWSKPAVLETRRSNLASHENGIEWGTIPKTFKDAILVVLDLGLRYIWIDSLCIIQDDLDDKWQELAKMSSIYANSHITIAATLADGGGKGCYSEVSPYHQDHRVSAKLPDATTITADLYVRKKIAHIGEQGAVTPLLNRGWVCQERLLPPRVLHFCEKELVWECQESSSCQCSSFDPPMRLKEKYSQIFRGRAFIDNSYLTSHARFRGFLRSIRERGSQSRISSEQLVTSPDDNIQVILMWRHIISEYSGMDLTEPSDRLPAISGVATQFGELLNSGYLAGLWQTALPDDLLWRTDHMLESEQHRLQTKTPSWSWASTEWKIKYYKIKEHHKTISIVRALCDPVTKVNPFGEVSSGWLEVDASTAMLVFTLDMSEDKTKSRRRLEIEFLGDSAVFIPDYDISVGAASKYAHSRDSNSVEYHFLCIGSFIVERTDAATSLVQSGESLAVSLVVQLVGKGKYERVGILERTRRSFRSSISKSLYPSFPEDWENAEDRENNNWDYRKRLILI
ncbi:HET-like protein [Alternaria alternata]|nr:HET-like protein [Alternaria alternata]